MKLLFKQKFFSWLDSYDIFDENGNIIFIVKGKLAWGHCLQIYDTQNNHIGTIKEEIFTFMPRFALYIGDQYIGDIKKKFTWFKPTFTLDCNNWEVNGDIFEWEYHVVDLNGNSVMHASKQLFNWTDTYVIDVVDSQNALLSLMIVLAIDAAKCSSNSN